MSSQHASGLSASFEAQSRPAALEKGLTKGMKAERYARAVLNSSNALRFDGLGSPKAASL